MTLTQSGPWATDGPVRVGYHPLARLRGPRMNCENRLPILPAIPSHREHPAILAH